MKIFIRVLIISMIFISCKNEKSRDTIVETIKPKTFEVILNVNVKQDDSFQLFYTDDLTPSFIEDKSVRVSVNGNMEDQQIVFTLPVDDIPTNLRLDLGENKAQSEIKLNSFSMSYADKTFTLNGLEILKYFVPGQIKINKQLPLLQTDQGEAEIYDPMFYPQDNLKQEIKKLIN